MNDIVWNKVKGFIYLTGGLLLLQNCQQADTLFISLSPNQTNIHFSNRITESDSINILVNEYIYNGGGVAIADFDKNGLPDVYFTGNMVDNRLYLNQGDFQFQDITEIAGVAAQDRWSSGVAVVDINADGWEDLYICATNRPSAQQRRNSLFVHQGLNEEGIPVFKEMAAAYGLDDTSHTTNSAFFDYDKDGDLDVYLAINQMDENNLPNVYREKITDGSSPKTDKLFRNDFDGDLGHPVFTDVSQETGILIEGFSLGINITDINKDGWQDIYVTNDFVTNDLMYINNQNGTFTNHASDFFQHTSHSAMGNDVVDLNNDGLSDFIALDMLPEDNFRRKTMLMGNNYTSYLNNDRYNYDYQYVRNTLQLNRGQTHPDSMPHFSEIAMLAGISSTDWSWTPLVADFDQDGFRDVIVTNGFPRDITDRDFVDYYEQVNRLASRQLLLQSIPQVKIKNYAYRNKGDLTFENVGGDWGIDRTSFSNGAAYADLDDDGDLDYIVNNINDSAFVFQNLTVEKEIPNANYLKIKLVGSDKNLNGLGAKIEISSEEQQWYWEQTPYRGYLSSVESKIHFGLGSVGEVGVKITWSDGKIEQLEKVIANQTITLDYKNAATSNSEKSLASSDFQMKEVTNELGLNFEHEEIDFVDFNVQALILHKLSQYGPGLAVSDVNQDGLEDFYVSGSRVKKGQFFIQQPNGKFEVTDLFDESYTSEGEELSVLFFDADLDGDEDLYLAMGSNEQVPNNEIYQDQLFLNNDGIFSKAISALPEFLISSSSVKSADYDRDGDLDLFVGSRVKPFSYPQSEASYVLQNNGKGKFSIAENLELGMVCDGLWTDYDQDGWVDLLLAREFQPLSILKNEKGQLKQTETIGLEDKIGWWNSLASGDFDQDGDIDYVAGNLGWNHLFQNNISIYAADFDGNGGYDVLPAVQFLDRDGNPQNFPYFGRIDFQKQVIVVRKHYPLHRDFAVAPFEEILPKISEVEPLHLSTNYLATSYIENLGNGDFEVHTLPVEAQFAPTFGILAEDVNEDGNLDIVLIGNDYGMEVGMGKQDAAKGLILLGDGTGSFKVASLAKSQFIVDGDAKSIVQIYNASGKANIIAAQNRGQLKAYQYHASKRQQIMLQALEYRAEIKYKNGETENKEIPYGSSFLSASSRSILAGNTMIEIKIYAYDGNERIIKLNQEGG